MQHSTCFVRLVPLLLMQAPFTMAAGVAPQPGTSGGITEVVLERTWCYGSCPIDKLVLRADGTADYTGMENTPRTGSFTGKFRTGDFDRLAQWLVTEGYFGLQDSYGFPNADTSSHVIRIARGGERKSVINHSFEYSLQVWGMENVILAVAAGIPWQPVPSGIRGEFEANASLSIYPEKQGYTPSGTKERFEVRADGAGRFEIPLAPGLYSVASGSGTGAAQNVVVEPHRFAETIVRQEAAIRRNTTVAISTVPPGDGLYVHALVTPAKYIFRKDTAMFLLGGKWEPVIQGRQLWADSKDNSTFVLGLETPWDAAVNPASHYLIVNGTVYSLTGAGSRGREASILYFRIRGEQNARQVARYFAIPVRYFRDPGYLMNLFVTPTRSSFRHGEAVTAALRIVNTGTTPIEFSGRPAARGRHDYCTFLARRNGQAVPDISFSGQRGGHAYPVAILPAAGFEDTLNLSEWFEFKDSGTYDIHGSCQLYLRNPRSGSWLPVDWTESAEVDFTVVVEPRPAE